jgi:hypothetical protein
MANYNALTRTNYFSVTDEAKFNEIIASCRTDVGGLQVLEPSFGSRRFGFGCYGIIYGIPPNQDVEEEGDLYAFYDALQSVLVDSDAIIITEIGYEKLRYLVGYCTVITKRKIKLVDLHDTAVELARDMLENPKFITQMDY